MVTNETHYAYIRDATGHTVPMKTFNLYESTIGHRRELIHSLINNDGECLQRLPLKFDMMDKSQLDLNELEKFIN